MAKKRSRGGYREPSKPAAVSGPGALSARTDGGAGSKTQPIRRIPGQAYGEGQALVEQQQAAPLPVARRTQQPTKLNIFSPTERPAEPITEGAMLGPGSPPAQAIDEDANMLLAAMYQVYPSSIISELINQGSN
jgi:hypothetical protein